MHLHLHTQFSIIDGRGRIKDYVALAKQDEQTSLAITDHGNLGGVIEGYLACKEADIKFIPGIELYVDTYDLRERNYPGHLTVLAKNESGYRALIAINNLAHRQFYYRPRVTLKQILDNGYAKDWIILTGCMSSPVFDGSQSDAENLVKQLAKQATVGLEIMWHYSEDEEFKAKQQRYIERIVALKKSTGLPVVMTNDCHYAFKHDEEFHQQLRKNSHNDKSELEFDGEGFFFKGKYDLQDNARRLGFPDAADNAIEFSKLCNVVIPEADKVNWYVPDITNGKPLETIRKITEHKLSSLPPEYRERYEYELGTLASSPAILNSYLVTYDLVDWCKRQGIPCAARGSMAGSLVSWLLGITLEDPIKYRLSFSRAVNPARPSIPDFDLDVSSQQRGAILDYLKERYAGNIPIAAYTHYGPKGAFRKVLSVEGLRSPMEINELSKPLPPDWSDGSFAYSSRSKTYQGLAPWADFIPEQYHNFVGMHQGLYNSVSVHPSGILISGPERELENEVPLQWIASSKTMASALDMYTIKKIGLYKLDVLGLRTLDQLAYMERISGESLPDDNYDDPKVLEAFSSDLLAEIFQMDGYAAREVIKSIGGINHFEDIVAANSLARPGASQFTQYYRAGYTGLLHLYPELGETLGYTNGLILYQEQVMEIGRILANFDDAEQDDIKEAIKYFKHDEFQGTIATKFRERMSVKGMDPEPIISAIVKFGGYAFNRAHAMTYAAIAYKMMWYKIYHPAVYYAAVYDGAADKHRIVLESHVFGVKWYPADINYSQKATVVRDGSILLGLGAIKGVGPAAYETISQNRPYASLDEFMSKVERRKCNIRIIENLQSAFACTSIGIKGKNSAFNESFGFPYTYLNSEISKELSSWQQEQPTYRLGGFVAESRTFKIKSPGPNQGKEMLRAEIANILGKKRCVMFPDVFKKHFSSMYQGSAVKLLGEYNLNGEFLANICEEVRN